MKVGTFSILKKSPVQFWIGLKRWVVPHVVLLLKEDIYIGRCLTSRPILFSILVVDKEIYFLKFVFFWSEFKDTYKTKLLQNTLLAGSPHSGSKCCFFNRSRSFLKLKMEGEIKQVFHFYLMYLLYWLRWGKKVLDINLSTKWHSMFFHNYLWWHHCCRRDGHV